MDFFFHLGSLFFSKLYKIKDAIMGSLVYSIYAHFYLSKDIWKNVIEFFIGVVVCIYMTPVLADALPGINVNFLSFVTGLSGMKLVEIVLLTDWKSLLTSYIQSKINKPKQ